MSSPIIRSLSSSSSPSSSSSSHSYSPYFLLFIATSSAALALYSLYKSSSSRVSPPSLPTSHSHSSHSSPHALSPSLTDRAAFYISAYTQLTEESVRIILTHYLSSPSESYLSHKELKGGLSNSNYYIKTNEREFLLKVCDEKSYEELEKQIRALNLFRLHRLPIAYPILLASASRLLKEKFDSITGLLPSAFICELNQTEKEKTGVKKPIICYDFLNGKPPMKNSVKVMREIGKGLGKLHSVPVDPFIPILPPFPMGITQWALFLENELLSAPPSVQSHPFISTLRSFLSSLSPVVDDPLYDLCVLHGDLFLENTIFNNETEEMLGIIDWEEMCVGSPLLDLTMTIVGCCYDERNELNLSHTHALLHTYQEIRPLSIDQQAVLDDFLFYSLLSIAFWRFRQFQLRAPNAERKNSYEVMTKRMETYKRGTLKRLLTAPL